MSDHIPDPTKMISDTPIMDAVDAKCDERGFMDTICYAVCEGQKLERELNAANERIKRLEEALDTLTLVVGLTPIRGNLAALQEAMDESRAVLKAKEAKL